MIPDQNVLFGKEYTQLQRTRSTRLPPSPKESRFWWIELVQTPSNIPRLGDIFDIMFNVSRNHVSQNPEVCINGVYLW